MQTFDQQRKKFLDFLGSYQFPNEPQQLYGACRHILSIGGKRIRPVLCLMANELFRDDDGDAMKAALAIELFHNFSLVHDDIMDQADIRRGQPTVHKKYSLPTAILSGDALNVFAYDLLIELQSDQKIEIIKLFNKTAIEVCEGQQIDMDFESRVDVSIVEYLKMIELKTSVLLAASLAIGALVGGASEEDVRHLYKFGRNVGIAFQLKDDYLDAYGDVTKTGKKLGGDILANKKTIFYCYCLQLASDEQQLHMHNLQLSTSADKLDKTLALYDALGARDFVYALKEKYSQEAFEELNKVQVPTEKREQLHELALQLLAREH